MSTWTEGIGQLLSQRDVCELLRISRSTFFRLPYFQRRKIRVGRLVRYKLTDVIAFEHELAERRVIAERVA